VVVNWRTASERDSDDCAETSAMRSAATPAMTSPTASPAAAARSNGVVRNPGKVGGGGTGALIVVVVGAAEDCQFAHRDALLL
jgi:hypothetical protein